ncbi:MAG: hypothetical protein K0R24_2340 [Gammaproteobacteria bacterium]|nr:hypothetical protein [Gammaproteobacteria bacterium]
MYRYKKQSGIGLLELMLSMAIIAILIVMSITYFQSSKNKTLITAGTQEIQSMIGVIAGLTDPSASAGGTKTDGNLTTTVALSGSLPKEYINKTTDEKTSTTTVGIGSPWLKADTYSITYDPDTKKATIIGTGLPNYACEGLSNQFVVGGSIESSDCATGVLTITINTENNQGITPNEAPTPAS